MTTQLHVPVFEPIVDEKGKLTPYGIKNWQTLGTTAVNGITQLTGDGTTPAGGGVEPLTLATVNANVGTFGDATHVAQVTVNGKGLVTAASNVLMATSSSRQLWQYQAKTTATSGYPGDGNVLWNNATQTSATALLFAHITDDTLDIDLFLGYLASGDTIILQDANDSLNQQTWLISGAPTNTNPGTSTSYWTVPVTLSSSGGTGTTGFPNNHRLIAVVFVPSTAGTVTTTGTPASGNLTKFSGAMSITNGDLSGDVTTSNTLATTISANAVTTTKINNAAVTLAKIQNATANSVLVGSGSAGSGAAYSEIALGTGLTMTGTTLSAAGTGGTVTHTGTLTANELVVGNGGADIKVVAAADGQIPIGKSSDGSVTLGTLTPGAGVTITNGAASVVIAATGGTGSSAVPILVSSNTTVASGTGMVIPEQLEIAGGVIFEIVGGARVEITGAAEAPLQAFRIKKADVVITSNAVLANDTELTFPVNPNETWMVDYFLFATGDTGATGGGLKCGLNVPSGATGPFGRIGVGVGSNSVEFAGRWSAVLNNFTGGVGTGTVAVGSVVNSHYFAAVTMGLTGGSITLQIAQNTSDATSTTLKAGSYLRAVRMQ